MPDVHAFPAERSEKRQWLLRAVEQIRPILAESFHDSERTATLAPAAVAALREHGLFNLKLPAVLGGAEADPIVQMEVIEALAYIDTASAWCTMVGATSVAMPGAFLSEAGIRRVFADSHIPLTASAAAPAGVAVPADGGYRVTGRWRFCSGIRHAEWVFGGAAVQAQNGQEAALPDVISVIFPVQEVTIHDNWQVMGLKGTGSCDFSVCDHFVPHDLIFRRDRINPAPLRGGSLYRLAIPGFVANEHMGFALGIARRALDELMDMARNTRGAYRPAALHKRQVVHRVVGKFDLELRAARSLAVEWYEAVVESLEAGQPIEPHVQAGLSGLATYIIELALEIATTAFRYGGAGALFQPNILELLLRDIQAAAQHIQVSDQGYENYGKLLLG